MVSTYFVILSIIAPPPVKTTLFNFLLLKLLSLIFCHIISKVSSIRGLIIAFKLDLVICLNVFLSPEIIGISIISWSSLGDETREPYKVFNLSALEILVDKPLAISNVTLLLPTPIASPYTNLLFSNTEIEDV